MGDVNVPAVWLAQGYLPRTCARHGVPASTSCKRSFHTKPPLWVYILILASVLVFLIVVLVMRKTVSGHLPACASCTAERRRYLGSVLGGWVATVALFIAAGLTSSGALLLLGFAAVLAALVWSCCGDLQRVHGSLTADQVWVTLRGAHASFADQLQQALRPPPQPVVTPAPTEAPASYAAVSPPALPSPSPGASAPVGYPVGRDILPGR
jgi:hypothetical protein